MTAVTREQALAFRASGHHLDRRRPAADLLAIAGACGIRNTPPGSAPLALAARLDGLPPTALDDALTNRSLVEVLAMRISPHVVPAADLATFTRGARPTDEASLRTVLASHIAQLDAASISAAEALALASEAAHAILADGPLARGALSAGITRRLPEPLRYDCSACRSRHVPESLFRLVGVAGGFVLAREGRTTLYVRPDRWHGTAGAASPPDAAPGATDTRAELLRRYLRCFGPSAPAHFAKWVGIGTAEARRAFDAGADDLVTVMLDGRRTWIHGDDLNALLDPPEMDGVRLLPPYDAYLDQPDRETLLPERALHAHVWRIIGNPGAILADGEVVGIWRGHKKGRRLAVTVEPFAPLSPAIREEIKAEAARLAPHRGCTSVDVTQ